MASKSALIVVDMQNDFCAPDGALSVAGAMEIVPLINRLLDSSLFILKVATRDYHPANHISFASNHSPPNNRPFESFIEISNVVGDKPEETMQQRLWPVHCVQGTTGADIVAELDVSKVDITLHKGMDARVEMYSAFSDSFGNQTNGFGGVDMDLAQVFRDKGVTDVYVVGVAGDYCVNYTALGAAEAGFQTYVLEDGQKCVDPTTWSTALEGFHKASVKVVDAASDEVSQFLKK